MADTLIEHYEQLAEEVADEAVDIIKRLIALSGSRPLGENPVSPFEVWANAERLLGDDDQVAGYAAQFGWQGLQKLIQMRDDAARRRGLFMPLEPETPEAQGGV